MKGGSETKNDFWIDKDQLDVEWLRQPMLYHKYARSLVKAKEELATAEQEMDLVRADLSKKIRSRPHKYGLGDTVTERGIEATIEMQDTYQNTKRNVRQCSYNVEILQSAVRTIEQRKSALENLVRLFLAEYYSSPSSSTEEGRKFINERRGDEVSKKVHQHLNPDAE